MGAEKNSAAVVVATAPNEIRLTTPPPFQNKGLESVTSAFQNYKTIQILDLHGNSISDFNSRNFDS